jgi:alpha-L-rhamnosidase
MRVTIHDDPFAHLDQDKTLWTRGAWPARWVAHADPGAMPFVAAYRRQFKLAREEIIHLHVTADERYALYLDGVLIGRGPERGDAENWFFETYEVTIPPGRHVLVARVWSLGSAGPVNVGEKPGAFIASPLAQMSLRHGFLLACDEAFLPLLATGVAEWEAKHLQGYRFFPSGLAWGTGARLGVDGATFAWNAHRGDGDGWLPVEALQPGAIEGRMEAGPSHLLRPAQLPAMIERYIKTGRVRHIDGNAQGPIAAANNLASEQEETQLRWINRQPFTIEPETRRRILIDLENYYCAYPLIVTDGGKGATVRLSWAESLFETPNSAERKKGDRSQIEGKYFHGVGDTFWPDGGANREFETLWWEAGRYLELYVETAEEPVEVNLILRETRYPLEMSATFESSEPKLAATIPPLLRGLQMCAHETYMDCPYYEQLMYVGDTRLEALVTYVISGDDRLARKPIELFNASCLPSGLTQSRYPCRVRQVIPPFSLLWIAMLHDFALWRNDPAFVKSMMGGVRAVIDAYCSFRNTDGLVEGPVSGWNFVDWAIGWKNGVPPDADHGVSSVINWQFVYALRLAGELEGWFGEPELAARCDRLSREISGAIHEHFWEPVRGLFADDPQKRHFSEHAQCLAILSGLLPEDRLKRTANALLTSPELTRTTIYFTHYLFETYRTLADNLPLSPDPIAALFDRLSLWFNLGKHGFVTPFEEPEPTRSDCHGWGTHPLFHYFATILGVRPSSPGFATIEIRPHLGELTFVRGTLPHPGGGEINLSLERRDAVVGGTIILPDGVTGIFWNVGQTYELSAGPNTIFPSTVAGNAKLSGQ